MRILGHDLTRGIIALLAAFCLTASMGCSDDDAEQGGGDSGEQPADAGDSESSPDAPDADDAAGQQPASIQILQEAHSRPLEVSLRTADGANRSLASALEPQNAALAEVDPGVVSFSVRDTEASRELATVTDVELVAGRSYILAVVGIQDPESRPTWPSNPDGADIGVKLVLEELAPATASTSVRLLHAVPDAGESTVSFNNAENPQIDGLGFGEFSAAHEIEPYLGSPFGLVRIALGRSQGEFIVDKQTGEIDEGLHGTIVVHGFVEEENRANQLTENLRVSYYPAAAEGPSQPLFGTATYRFFHLSPDVGPLEVRAGGKIVVEEFSFRDKTGSMPAPAQHELNFEFVSTQGERAGQTVASEQIFLQSDQLHTFIAAGLVDASDNDVLDNIDFDLQVFTDKISLPAEIDDGRAAIWGFYSTTDEFSVDFSPAGSNHRMFENMYFGSWKGPVLRDTTEDILLELELPGSELVGRYNLPLASQNLSGESVLLIASGYLTPDGEDGRTDAPAFELRMHLLDGTEMVIEPQE